MYCTYGKVVHVLYTSLRGTGPKSVKEKKKIVTVAWGTYATGPWKIFKSNPPLAAAFSYASFIWVEKLIAVPWRQTPGCDKVVPCLNLGHIVYYKMWEIVTRIICKNAYHNSVSSTHYHNTEGDIHIIPTSQLGSYLCTLHLMHCHPIQCIRCIKSVSMNSTWLSSTI